jgi:hypothetical protein
VHPILSAGSQTLAAGEPRYWARTFAARAALSQLVDAVRQTSHRASEVEQDIRCRLFHRKSIFGPFADEGGAYFLCEVGHRFPCDGLPAALPPRKLKVWTEPEAGEAPEPTEIEMVLTTLERSSVATGRPQDE